jgi:hypothetical protein
MFLPSTATAQRPQDAVQELVDAPMAEAAAEEQPPPLLLPPRLRRRRQRAPSTASGDEDSDGRGRATSSGSSSSAEAAAAAADDDDVEQEYADTPTTTASASSSLPDDDHDDARGPQTASPRHLRHRAAAAAADADADAGASSPPHQPPRRRRRRRPLVNRVPTPQDLAELSFRVYKKSPRRLYAEADAQGMRVWRDERVDGDVRIVLAVPAWFPLQGNASFDWTRVAGGRVSVVAVVRGTCPDIIGNTKSNLELLYSRLVDDGRLPDAAHAAAAALQRWLLALVAPHPELGGGGEGGALEEGGAAAPPLLSLDVTCTGHSLGAFIAEAACIENDPFAAARGWSWRAVTFDGPGLPQPYADAALARRGGGAAARAHWRASIRRYLAAPNPINMIYPQTSLGAVTHVLVPFEQTWSHVARCVVADAARVLGWAVAATVGVDAFGRWRQRRRQSAAAAAGEAGAEGGGGGPQAEGEEDGEEDDEAAAAGNNNNSNNNSNSNNNGGNGRSALLQGAAAVAAAQLRRAGAGATIPVLGPLAAWAMGAAGLAAIPECIAAALGVEVEELLTQHGLGSMRPSFDPDTGELRPERARPMRSWPHLGARGQVVLLSACAQVAAWTLPSPLCPSNVGVVHLGSRSRMVEARCRRLAGYVPLDADAEGGFEALDREDEEREAAEAAAAAAAAEAKARAAARGGQGEPDAAMAMEALPAAAAAAEAAPQPQPQPQQQQQHQDDDAAGPLYSAAEAAAAAAEGSATSFGAGGTLPPPPLLQELPPGPELDAAVATPLRTAVTVAAAEALRLRPQRDPAFQAPPIAPGLASRARQAQLLAAQAAAARRRQLQRQQQQQPSAAGAGGRAGGAGGGGGQRQLPGPAFA